VLYIVLSFIQQKKTYLIDISIPRDSRRAQKTVEQLTEYHDFQIDKMWHTSFRTVPIIIGALGSNLPSYLSCLEAWWSQK